MPVKSIQEEFQGIMDEQVIQIATAEKLTILTFDKDYGELVFRYGAANPPSVIYFREKGHDPLFAGRTLVSLLLENGARFENAFTVIEQNSIRQRLYKTGDR